MKKPWLYLAAISVALGMQTIHAAEEAPATTTPGQGATTMETKATGGIASGALEERKNLPKAKLAEVLPGNIKLAGNAACSIDSEVCRDGDFYRFLVRAPHGDYDILSISKLGKTLGEAEVLEHYRSTPQGNQAWLGAKESLKDLGRGLKSLVIHPGASAKAIGRGFARMGRSIGRLAQKPFKKEKPETAGDGSDRTQGAKNFLYGDELRKFAYELGVDAYTDNIYLQALMRRVAKQRATGRMISNLSVTATTFVPYTMLVPYNSILQGALTPGGLNQQAEIYIRDNDPQELKRINRKLWKDNLGVEPSRSPELKSFLDNPNYTPRESTYVRIHLERLKQVGGLFDALTALGAAQMPLEAEILLAQLELLADYHSGQESLQKLLVVGKLIAAQGAQSGVILILPYDIVENDEDATQIIAALRATAQPLGGVAAIWLTGKASPEFAQAVKTAGIRLEEQVLSKNCFAAK